MSDLSDFRRLVSDPAVTSLQRRLAAALETIRIYEDFLRELGIDTDQPQEAIFEELRRRWDELVVAADPSVMENR